MHPDFNLRKKFANVEPKKILGRFTVDKATRNFTTLCHRLTINIIDFFKL